VLPDNTLEIKETRDDVEILNAQRYHRRMNLLSRKIADIDQRIARLNTQRAKFESDLVELQAVEPQMP
ncbi:MAG: hypothetical protein ACR2QW_10020, partial [bacterium]